MSWLITGAEKTAVDRFGIQNVSLLLHGNGTNGSTTIVDSSPTPKTVTAVGNAQISTAQSKFGGASIAFDGSGDYLTVSSGLPEGTEDFTIEWWEKLSATNVGYPIVRFSYSSGSGIKTGNNAIQLYTIDPPYVNVTYTYVSTTDWQHIAISRQSGTVRMFANGVLLTNALGNLNPNISLVTSPDFFIGRAWTVHYLNDFSGYIDDLRITKGIARYTANFTPPTAPFPDI